MTFKSFRTGNVLLLFMIAFLLSSPVRAVEIDKKGAKELKNMFEEILEFQQDAASLNRGKMKIDGEIKVEPADSYYAVTLPHISFVEPGEGYFNVGIIAINVIPSEDTDLWKMSVALPTPMTGYDAGGNPVFTVDLGRQRMFGVWHKQFENFVKLDAAYENMLFSLAAENVSFTMPSMKIFYNLNENEKGGWSGPLNFVLDDIKLAVNQEQIFSADSIKVNSEIIDVSPGAMKEYKQRLTELAEKTENQPGAGKPDPEQITGIFSILFESMDDFWDGFATDFVIENLKIAAPEKAKGNPREISLAKAGYGFDMKGVKSGSVTMAFRMSYDGLELMPVPVAAKGVYPRGIKINLQVDKIPFKELLELGQATLKASLESPERAQMSGMQAMMSMPQILSAAGTTLKVLDMNVEAEKYSAVAEGEVIASAGASYGLISDARAKIYGLDALISELKGKMQNPEIADKAKAGIKQNLQGLAMLQMVGKQEKDEEGREMRVYNFKVTPEGLMTLNGGDLSALAGMMNDKNAQQQITDTAPVPELQNKAPQKPEQQQTPEPQNPAEMPPSLMQDQPPQQP
jgi:hypothetical protein